MTTDIFRKEFLLDLNWQNSFVALSFSQPQLSLHREHIRKQEEYHKVKSYQQEYNEMVSNMFNG